MTGSISASPARLPMPPAIGWTRQFCTCGVLVDNMTYKAVGCSQRGRSAGSRLPDQTSGLAGRGGCP